MLRCQNQEYAGFVTPGSSDVEEDEWSTKKLCLEKYIPTTVSDSKCRYLTEKNKRSNVPCKDFTNDMDFRKRLLFINESDVLTSYSSGWGGCNARSPEGEFWRRNCDHEDSLTRDLNANRVLKDDILEIDADNLPHNFVCYPKHSKPTTVKVNKDGSIRAKADTKSITDCLQEFSLESPTRGCTSINSNKFQSYLSLLEWGKYLLTPKKSLPISMQLSATNSPSSLKSSLSDHMDNSRIISILHGESQLSHSLQFQELEPWNSPIIPVSNYLERQTGEDLLYHQKDSENSCSEQESTEKEVNYWNCRVLFPLLDTPLRQTNDQL